jgi:hypothetical protein
MLNCCRFRHRRNEYHTSTQYQVQLQADRVVTAVRFSLLSHLTSALEWSSTVLYLASILKSSSTGGVPSG